MQLPDISDLHQTRVRHWHKAPPVANGDGFLRLVEENHLRNFCIWHEEDVARRRDLPPERIVEAKRAIDRFNQERNDFIERMDELLAVEFTAASPDVPLHSESPGMIVDRLSILALKEYHMQEESLRSTATEEHRRTCAEKLAVIQRQRADLTGCLQSLLDDLRTGRRRFTLYRQFKMYNDPALNPELYRPNYPPSHDPAQ